MVARGNQGYDDSAMTTLSIALPNSMASFVGQQAVRKGHKDPAEYLKALIREAQRHAAREELEEKLIEGLNSGPSIEVTPEYWAKKKATLLKRHSKAARR